MTTPDPDIAAIAEGLSEAQWGWVLRGGYTDPNTTRALRRKGLAVGAVLTSLGLAVRNHILRSGR